MHAEPARVPGGTAPDRFDGPQPGALDSWSYRSAFRGHASGVGVVTADDGRGPVGLTVGSIVSLSLSPPLASLAVAERSSTLPTFSRAGRVAIHFLDDGQSDLAGHFAAVGTDRFTGPGWIRLACGTPVLTDPPAYVAGPVVQQLPAGDHRLFIVLLDRFQQRRPYAPLVYAGGRYGSATPVG